MTPRRFRVLSYNIHKGFTARNRLFVLREIRDAIRSMAPDFVFLQEVLGAHTGHRGRIDDWPGTSQFEYMADSLWPHFAYGRNAVYDEGHHGNAILSKYPILAHENEDVSTGGIEKRGLLHAVVRPSRGRGRLHLICAHFGLFERDRRAQARRLCARLRRTVERGQAVIVAGDFNDWTLRLSPYLKGHGGLEEAYRVRHGHHARTFPARMPILRLDRIYFRGMRARTASCLKTAPWARLSDHAPLIAEFEWS